MKRRKISQQAKDRRIMERDRRRQHTLACNDTRAKGFKANTEALLAQVEALYEAGEISITQYDKTIKFLGKEEVPDDEELGF